MGACVLRIVLSLSLLLAGPWVQAEQSSPYYAAKAAQDFLPNAQSEQEFLTHTQAQDMLYLTQQEHVVIKSGTNTQDVEAFSVSQAEVRNPNALAPNDLSKLDISYVQASSTQSQDAELHISLKRGKRTDRHVVRGLPWFTAAPRAKNIDNLLRFATMQGLHAVPLRVFRDSLFTAPLPVLHVLPAPPIEGAQITGIQVQHLVTKEFLRMAQSEPAYAPLLEKSILQDSFANNQWLKSGDVALRIKHPRGKDFSYLLSHEHESLEVAKRLALIYWWALFYDPDQVDARAVNNLYQEYASSIMKLPQTQLHQPEIVRALGQMMRMGDTALKSAVPQSGGKGSTLTRVARMERSSFSIQEQAKAWEKVQGLEQNTLQNLQKKSYQKAVGFLSNKVSHIEPHRWRAMARSTKMVLGLGGAAVAALLGASAQHPDTAAHLANYTLGQLQKMGQGVRGVWHQLTSEGGVLHHLPIAQEDVSYWYLGLGTLGVGILLHAAVAMNGLFVRSNHTRSWTPFRKFYLTTLKLMAFINYPVQAMLWETILRQKLLYGSLDHGLSLSRTEQNGQVTWHSILHAPWAKNTAIHAQGEKLNQLVEASQKKRAAYLMALARVGMQHQIPLAPLLLAHVNSLHGSMPAEYSADLVGFEKSIAAARFLQKAYADFQNTKLSGEDLQKIAQGEDFAKYQHSLQQVAASSAVGTGKNTPPKIKKRILQLVSRSANSHAMSFLLFGREGRLLSLRLEQINPSQHVTDVARTAAIKDYITSFCIIAPFIQLTPAVSDAGRLVAAPFVPDAFSGYTPAQMATVPKVPTMGGEQVVLSANLYLSAEAEHLDEELHEEQHKPLEGSYFAKEGASSKDKAQQRRQAQELSRQLFKQTGVSFKPKDLLLHEHTQGFLQGLKVMGQDLKQGGIKRAFRQHLSVIKKLIGGGLQGQVSSGSMWMSIGTIAGVMLSSQVASGFESIKASFGFGIVSAIQMIMIKHSFIGYTQVWPYTLYWNSLLRKNGAEHAAQLERSLFDIRTGIKLGHTSQMQKGVASLLSQYRDAKITKKDNADGAEIKPKTPSSEALFAVWKPETASNYTEEQAAWLYKYALNTPPYPTKPNTLLNKWLLTTGLGVVGSTVLAFAWVYEVILGDLQTIRAEHGDAAAWEYLGRMLMLSAAALAGTVGVLKLGVSEKPLKKIKSKLSQCVKLLKT